MHTNDFFWLHPFSQLRAPGAQRFFVGSRALLVRYTTGGVTPGDAYLIITDEQGLPIRWQMWVSILPLKGFTFSFEDWQTFSTGARLSTTRRSPVLDIRLQRIKTYSHYPMLTEPDRFLELHQLQEAKK